MKNRYKIIVVDDHQLFLDGMIRILEDESEFEIIGFYNNGSMLLHALNSCQPDLIILDIQMPKQNGIDVSLQIKNRYPNIKILFISMFEASNIVRNIKKIGANGFISKTTDASIVKNTIWEVLKGNDVFIQAEPDVSDESMNVNVFSLSKRETEIISLIKKGMSSKEIAETLNISGYTVETHRKNIFRKLKVKSVSELVSFAYDNEL